MFLPRWIGNDHILWLALGMVALGLLVPGGFGMSPPQWFAIPEQEELTLAIPKQEELTLSIPEQEELTLAIPEQEGTIPNTDHERVPKPVVHQPAEMVDVPAMSVEVVVPSNLGLDDSHIKSVKPPDFDVITIKANFVRKIPAVHLELSGVAQKKSFVELILPLIVAANDELLHRRNAVKESVDSKNRAMMEKWAILYRVNPENLNDTQLAERLLRRVDTIPVALALAQAAVESGWGTSRFALQGNALFGQWAWTDSAGIRPLAASNDRAVVRSFGSLLESVRAYMHNLNTHPNYHQLRNARERLKPENEYIKANELAAHLDSYAEIGEVYVDKIRAIISSNGFDKYARARFS